MSAYRNLPTTPAAPNAAKITKIATKTQTIAMILLRVSDRIPSGPSKPTSSLDQSSTGAFLAADARPFWDAEERDWLRRDFLGIGNVLTVYHDFSPRNKDGMEIVPYDT